MSTIEDFRRETRAWLGYFRAQGIDCMSFDSIRGKAKDIVARIEKASADAVYGKPHTGMVLKGSCTPGLLLRDRPTMVSLPARSKAVP